MKKYLSGCYIFIFINILVFIIDFAVNNTNRTDEHLILIGGYVSTNNLFYNFIHSITCQFIHSDIIHFLGNIVAMIFVNIELSKLAPTVKINLLYIQSILVVAISLILFAQDNLVYIGCSGVVYGLITYMLILKFNLNTNITILNYIKSEIVLILGLILINFLPNISILMHLSGVISGVVFYFMCNYVNKIRSKQK